MSTAVLVVCVGRAAQRHKLKCKPEIESLGGAQLQNVKFVGGLAGGHAPSAGRNTNTAADDKDRQQAQTTSTERAE